MKILLLNQAFHPDVVSTGQHASDLAAQLAALGHSVTVLASRRAYDNSRQRFARRETWRGVRIIRVPSTGFGKAARWRRALDFASFFVSCMGQLVWLPRFDAVVALTSPPLISVLGALFALLTRGRFVFWVMDLNPDEAIAAGWLRRDSRTARTLSALLRFSLRHADRVVALDRFMAERIQEKGIEQPKITVIAPWSHDHTIRYDAAGREAFRNEQGWSGKYVTMYSGNHSPCHPLDTLLETARRLQNRADIVFCFAGGGSEFGKVQEFAAREGLGNIVCLPYQPLERLSASLSSADLHVVVMGDPFVGIVHPCKVYNILALSIPYLYIGPERSHVSELGPVASFRHGEVEAIVRQVVESSQKPGRARTNGHAGAFAQGRLVRRMVRVIEDCGEGRAPEGEFVKSVGAK